MIIKTTDRPFNYIFARTILWLALLTIQACSNSEIGNQLERSFDYTTQKEEDIDSIKKLNDNKVATKIRNKDLLKKPSSFPRSKVDHKLANKESKNNSEYTEKKSIEKKVRNFRPKPYRIILKLSGANPSAPAESVTKALRQAGVEFEVEKIESFEENSKMNTIKMKR